MCKEGCSCGGNCSCGNSGKEWVDVRSKKLPDNTKVVQVTYLSYPNKDPLCDALAYCMDGLWYWNSGDNEVAVEIVAWRYIELEPYEGYKEEYKISN